MMRKTPFLAAMAVAASAQFAAAEEHTVLFLGDAFFPTTSYVQAGDTIRFVNTTGQTLNIAGEGSAWAIGPINPDGAISVTVTPDMQTGYFDADASADGAAEASDDITEAPIAEGRIEFGAPPQG